MEHFCYLDQLISDCNSAKSAVPIKEFILSKRNDFDEIKSIKSAIYIIEEIDGDSQKTFDEFNAFRKEQEQKEERDKLKCAQSNSPSAILYVGSSTTGLKKRLKEHTISSSKKTHALRLNEWFNGDYKIDVKLYDVSRAVLQLIEDNLAHNLKPAFGKRGSNNK